MIHIDIEPRIFHFKQPAGTSRGVYTERKSWMIHLQDDSMPGKIGIGECAPLPDLSCDAIADYDKILRAMCDMYCIKGEIPYEALRPYPSMLFGLETAVMDLKAENHRIFDTPFSRGEKGITINGLVWMGNYQEMLQRMQNKIDAGFHCIKIKIGAIDFEKEIELIKIIREHFPKNVIEIRVDANGGFNMNDALQKMERLAKYDIHSIEQPIKQKQWKEMASLCKSSTLDIALDEELIGINIPDMKREMLDTIQPKYVVIKPSLHGGMKGSKEWIDMAGERGIGSWITSALESNVGLNAVAQLCAYLYGDTITMPQGLGTGQLFNDNIQMPIVMEGEKIWFKL